ncbi:class I SAM-dependent methyltransferase [Limnohabitans sp. WS1]|uniref:class I SAM-dependent methyltransferase n=1 Tax=Limnohabitans sp. WS1 TaxID=1100726 RepID=UPI0013049359|nr:class I SAM-dependent methyltransferase [Limnohabitans sp. WS1]
MSLLEQLIETHTGKTTDKWSLYVREYARLFEPYRDQPICLLEIGVQNGGSLEVWSDYFAQARVLVGCDIDEGCRNLTYADSRVHVVVGDASTVETRDQILSISATFDIIIDDGSHTASDIVKSFALYFERLSEGGLYIVEDLHCSYWQNYQGGLHNPLSSIHFFKSLCDIVNHQSWGLPMSRRELLTEFSKQDIAEFSEDLLAQIHSVEFLNSICVVRKAAAPNNTLGPRIVRGQEAFVDVGPLGLDGQDLVAPLQCMPDLAAPLNAEPLLFDEDFYLSNYPDVAAAGVNAFAHYLGNGKSEGRHPTADRAALAALQEAKVWGREQAAVLAGIAEFVADNGDALTQAIEASQKQLEFWHLQHAARFDQLTQMSVEQEDREVQRLDKLELNLVGMRAELTDKLSELLMAQSLELAGSFEASQSKLVGGQAEHAVQIAFLKNEQAKQAEQAQRQYESLHGEFIALKTSFIQINAAYWDAKQTYEACVAELREELEAERVRLAWRSAHPLKAFWRDLFSRKTAGVDA